MLRNFICHRDYVLKFAKMEKERCTRTGEVIDSKAKAQADALDEINTESVDAALAGLIWNLHSAKLKMQRVDSDDVVNAALIEIDEIGLSLRHLVEGLVCANGKLNEEIEADN